MRFVLIGQCLVIFRFSIIIFLAGFICGCPQQGGPTLPRDDIPPSLPRELKTAINGLYERDKDNVIKSIDNLGDMGESANVAVPYLASMLTDSRLGVVWIRGYGKTVPISKAVALALGRMGEAGITAMVDALYESRQDVGMIDDLLRESVALGLNQAIDTWGETAFRPLARTEGVKALIRTAEICLNLDDSPDRFDAKDPRRNLKYYKHFDEPQTREGLETYLTVLGLCGDKLALPLLQSVFPLAAKTKGADQIPEGPFERAAVISQYRIDPMPVIQIHPPSRSVLIIAFTAIGDHSRVKTLLDQGVNPDSLTRTGHPLIELAFRQNHDDILKMLMEHGAHVDIRLSTNNTLLMKAARNGEPDFVKTLLDHGADSTLTNNAGETALEAAATELFSFWNEKPYQSKAKPYFETIKTLQAAGSPPVREKVVKDLDKKSREFLNL